MLSDDDRKKINKFPILCHASIYVTAELVVYMVALSLCRCLRW